MSEYQYVHFIACDRPLDDKQLEFMHRQSTRADITRWTFANEYHYSGFRGKAIEMLRNGYDAHLDYCSYGVRTLMIRLPLGLPMGAKEFRDYEVKRQLTWTPDKSGPGGVLTISTGDESGEFDMLDDPKSIAQALPEIRKELIEGDPRALYLGWLACCDDWGKLEPPAPVGLDDLTNRLNRVCEFFEFSDAILKICADKFKADIPAVDNESLLHNWLAKQSRRSLEKYISELVVDDCVSVQRKLQTEIRKSVVVPTWPMRNPKFTKTQIFDAADQLQNELDEREAKAKANKRQKYLQTIANEPKNHIAKIYAAAGKKDREELKIAGQMLKDLSEAIGDQGPEMAKSLAIKLLNKFKGVRGIKVEFEPFTKRPKPVR